MRDPLAEQVEHLPTVALGAVVSDGELGTGRRAGDPDPGPLLAVHGGRHLVLRVHLASLLG